MTDKLSQNRPLSPHLTIYKPQITSVLSISHRASGFFLYFGLLVFAWHFIFTEFQAIAFGKTFVLLVEGFFATIIGKVALLFWLLAFFYHFSNGIRHLFWDIGKGYSIKQVKLSGLAVIASAFALTAYVWFYALKNMVY